MKKTYKVVVEPDQYEDGTQAFHAYSPALRGARTHGRTREEALENIRQVVQGVMMEDAGAVVDWQHPDERGSIPIRIE